MIMTNSIKAEPVTGKIMDNKKTEIINLNRVPKQCNHPTLLREYAYGGPTGNFICMQCECLVSTAANQQTRTIQNDIHKKPVNPLNLSTVII